MLQIFYLFIQNGDVYTAAELPWNKIAKSEEDLLDLIFLGRILKP